MSKTQVETRTTSRNMNMNRPVLLHAASTTSRTGANAAEKLGENHKLYPVVHAVPLSRDEPAKQTSKKYPPSSSRPSYARREYRSEEHIPVTLKKPRYEPARSLPVESSFNKPLEQASLREKDSISSRKTTKTQSLSEFGSFHGYGANSHYIRPNPSGRSESRDRSAHREGSQPAPRVSRQQHGVPVNTRLVASRPAPPIPVQNSVMRSHDHARTPVQMQTNPRIIEKSPLPLRLVPIPPSPTTKPNSISQYPRVPTSRRTTPTPTYRLPQPIAANAALSANKGYSSHSFPSSHPIPYRDPRVVNAAAGPPPLSRRNAISQSGRRSRSSGRT